MLLNTYYDAVAINTHMHVLRPFRSHVNQYMFTSSTAAGPQVHATQVSFLKQAGYELYVWEFNFN